MYVLGNFWGTHWDLGGHTLGTKKSSQKSNNTHPPQKKIWAYSVFFFFPFSFCQFCDVAQVVIADK
jgi:hypothetical protein